MLLNIQTILIVIITIIISVLLLAFLVFVSRFKKCPPDKIMVVIGRYQVSPDGSDHNPYCIHGGAVFVWPFIQNYQFMDLTSICMSIDLKNVLSKDKTNMDIQTRFTVAISTEDGVMQIAAKHLLGLRMEEIQEIARDIILGQLRFVIATMEFDDINIERNRFLTKVCSDVEAEIRKIGLRLINVNIMDLIN